MAQPSQNYGPYSTRDMHKFVRYTVNRKDGTKVVDKPSFISFGTKEKPEPYIGGKDALPDRWKYKIWKSPRVPVNAGDGFFGWPPNKGAAKDTPFKAFEYPGGTKERPYPFVDRVSYLKAKRPPGVSFQSKDASRRDEFSNTVRTEQYREALKKDKRQMDGNRNPEEELEAFLAWQTAEAGRRQFVEGLSETEFLYDIGRDQETTFDPKASRDRFFTQTLEKNMNRTKRMGVYATMSSSIGDFGDEFQAPRPEFGRAQVTKTFLDKGHLQSTKD